MTQILNQISPSLPALKAMRDLRGLPNELQSQQLQASRRSLLQENDRPDLTLEQA